MRAIAVILAALLMFALVPSGSSISDGPERVIVAFADAVPSDLDTFVAPYGVVVVESEDLAFAVVLTTKLQAPHLINALESRSDVVDAAVETSGKLLWTPNDPLYPSQWAPPAVGLPAVWDSEQGSHSVKVAYLDTGVDTDHPDLQANRAPECGPEGNTSEGSTSTSVEDTHGHGTHVAGIIGATMDNGIGVAGASQACLMAIKVCSSGCKTSSVALGVVYAKANGVRVLSASLGWNPASTGGANPIVLERAAQLAYDAGLLFIVAAGNDYCMNPSASTVNMPGRFDTTMAVSALTSPGDTTADFSSCGPEVDIAAPGDEILSTTNDGAYGIKSGTSMATPLVAGIAGLVWSANESLTRDQVRCILQTTADDLGAPGVDVRYGHGRVDAPGAVAAALAPASVGC